MKLTSLGRKEVNESRYGVYLWQLPSGQFISDDDGHYLMIESFKGDPKRIAALRNAAKDFGLEEGAPVFFSGHRVVSDEEYEEQRQRMLFGLIPDTHDVLAIEEAKENNERQRH